MLAIGSTSRISVVAALLAVVWCWYNGSCSSLVSYVAQLTGWSQGDGNVENALFTADELRKFDGGLNSIGLYLAILGRVFDVSKGRQHYEPGATYHFFVGKDGSRSFVTGDFSGESSVESDDVLDLSCSELSGLQGWLDTYHKQYTYKGKLVGKHYNSRGGETEYARALVERQRDCERERQTAERREAEFPPCNVEWSAATGSRVWCTPNSGGVSRDWAGVPRRLLVPGGGEPRCVCVDPRRDNSPALLQPFPGCPHTAGECTTHVK